MNTDQNQLLENWKAGKDFKFFISETGNIRVEGVGYVKDFINTLLEAQETKTREECAKQCTHSFVMIEEGLRVGHEVRPSRFYCNKCLTTKEEVLDINT